MIVTDTYNSNSVTLGQRFLFNLCSLLALSAFLSLISAVLLSSYFGIETSEMMFGVSWDAPNGIAQHGVSPFIPLSGPNDCGSEMFLEGIADCSTHWFGDLASGIEVARTANPWDSTVSNPYFPVAVGYYKILGFLPSNGAIVAHGLFTFLAAAFIAWRIVEVASVPKPLRWLIGLCLVFASQPVLYAFDRGNIHIICVALIVASAEILARERTEFLLRNSLDRADYKYVWQRYSVAAFCILNIVAISMKPSLALVIFAFFVLHPESKPRLLRMHAVFAALANIPILLLFDERMDRLLFSILQNIRGYAGASDFNLTIWRSSSLSSWIGSIGYVLQVEWISEIGIDNPMAMSLGVLVLMLLPLMMVLRIDGVPVWVVATGPLLATHFLLPRAYTYSLSVAFVVIFLVLWDLGQHPVKGGRPTPQPVILNLILLGAFCMLFYDPPLALNGPSNLIPSVFLNNFLAPLGVFFVWAANLLEARKLRICACESNEREGAW